MAKMSTVHSRGAGVRSFCPEHERHLGGVRCVRLGGGGGGGSIKQTYTVSITIMPLFSIFTVVTHHEARFGVSLHKEHLRLWRP